MNKFAKYICAIMVMGFVIAIYSISAFAERSGDPDLDADESYSGTWIFTQKESYFSKGELFDVIEGENGELIINEEEAADRVLERLKEIRPEIEIGFVPGKDTGKPRFM